MKRLLLFLTCSLLIYSCDKETGFSALEVASQGTSDYTTAAISAYQSFYVTTRSNVDVTSLYPIMSGNDTSAVVANFGSDDGFVVVSNDRVKSALLVCNTGHYDGITSGDENFDNVISNVICDVKPLNR